MPPTTDLYLPDDDYQTIKDGSELMAEIDINEENEKLLELKRKSEKHEVIRLKVVTQVSERK